MQQTNSTADCEIKSHHSNLSSSMISSKSTAGSLTVTQLHQLQLFVSYHLDISDETFNLDLVTWTHDNALPHSHRVSSLASPHCPFSFMSTPSFKFWHFHWFHWCPLIHQDIIYCATLCASQTIVCEVFITILMSHIMSLIHLLFSGQHWSHFATFSIPLVQALIVCYCLIRCI